MKSQMRNVINAIAERDRPTAEVLADYGERLEALEGKAGKGGGGPDAGTVEKLIAQAKAAASAAENSADAAEAAAKKAEAAAKK